MSLGEILLNEKTRVSVNIATLLFVIGFSITATFTFTTWKTEFQIIQQSEIVRFVVVAYALRDVADVDLSMHRYGVADFDIDRWTPS